MNVLNPVVPSPQFDVLQRLGDYRSSIIDHHAIMHHSLCIVYKDPLFPKRLNVQRSTRSTSSELSSLGHDDDSDSPES